LARPFVTLKLATSLDGKIALTNGQSQWITSEASRLAGRQLRAYHDAIAVGANTAVIDNPQLTTRLPEQSNPIRVVFDTKLRLSEQSNLALTAKAVPVWVFSEVTSGKPANRLKEMGVKLFKVPIDLGLDIKNALNILTQNGVTSLLVEGGGTLAASFIRLGFVDKIEWFRAPIILGGDGRNAIGDLKLNDLNLAQRYSRVEINSIGDDIHERYERIG